MVYILKMKTISDKSVAVREQVSDCDHVLQLLAGLGPEYNVVVASLTAREDDLSLHSVYCLHMNRCSVFLDTIPVTAHMAIQSSGPQ